MNKKIVNQNFNKKYFKTLYSNIEYNSSILDLGCGDGSFLHSLQVNKNCIVQGIDISITQILNCLEKGLPVIQADLNSKILKSFPDKSFDYVILSQTIQQVKKPNELLHEMIRIGKIVQVSFVNIAFLPTRLQFFLGKMPQSKTLPYRWYNTPNIHLGSHKDFIALCKEENIKIETKTFFGLFLANIFPNLTAELCLYTLSKKKFARK